MSEEKRAELTDPIEINMRGFLITYDRTKVKCDYEAIVAETIQLLKDNAADTFSFKHKNGTHGNQSPIFIESDVADPSALVEKMYTNFETMDKSNQGGKGGIRIALFDLQSYLVNIFPPDTDPHFYKSDQQDMVDSEFLEKDQYHRHHMFLWGN